MCSKMQSRAARTISIAFSTLLVTLILFVTASPGNGVSADVARLRPPVILEDPSDVSVRKHEPSTLNCKADGNPSPTIEWYKDGEKVRTTGNRMLLPSGALFFLHVIHNKKDADTGTYWCVARSELGKAKSRNATVSLATPHKQPRITEHPADIVVKKNEAATLSCKADGRPTPVIEWFKDGEKLRITDNRVILPSGSLFFLHVRLGQEEDADTGTYWCVARNEQGRAKSHNAILEVAEAPTGPPLDVFVKVINQTAALVTWSEPARASRHGPLSGFLVQLAEQGSGQPGTNYTASSATSSMVLDSLNPSATYEIRVFASNAQGSGPGSAPLSLRTDPRGDFIRHHHQLDKEPLLVKGANGDGAEFKDALKQPWFIIIAALTVMFITSSAVLIFLMRQISISKKPISSSHVTYTTSIQKGDYGSGHDGLAGTGLVVGVDHDRSQEAVTGREGLWLDPGWESGKSNTASKLLNTVQRGHGYANKMSEYSVIESGNDLYEEVPDNHSMSTFGKKEEQPLSQPSPYAMTTIINIPGNGNSSYRPRQQQPHPQQQQQQHQHHQQQQQQSLHYQKKPNIFI